VLSSQQQAREIAEAKAVKEAEPSMAAVVPAREGAAILSPKAANMLIAPVSVQQLNVIYLDPGQPSGLSELSALARNSLKQYPDLRQVASRKLVSEMVEKSNASLRARDRTAELLRQHILKVREVSVYFLASDNTIASWRGPDDDTGKGGIVIICRTDITLIRSSSIGTLQGA
jgi:hypothetical protein